MPRHPGDFNFIPANFLINLLSKQKLLIIELSNCRIVKLPD